MALGKCKECGTEVSTGAKTCPKCGVAKPTTKGVGKWSAIGAVVGVVWVASAIARTGPHTNPTGTAVEAAAMGQAQPQEHSVATPPAPEPAPMAVMAKQLHDDYAANEVSADDKYKGKVLAVGGTVASIDKDAFGNIVLKLRWPGANPYGIDDIMATLRDDEKPKAAQLSKGQPVAVRCKGNGMIIQSPMLDDCVVFANTK